MELTTFAKVIFWKYIWVKCIGRLKIFSCLHEEHVNWLDKAFSADAYITWNYLFLLQDIFGKREAFHFKN